jgi:hypothetical protein
MDETNERAVQPQRKSGVKRLLWVVWLFVVYIFDSLIDAVGENFRVIEREFQVFLGSTLILIGLFGFESDKFCDGNTADYLSCTRPSTYYFYDVLDVALIVIGALLILAWYLKRRSA